ncbi:glycosyltransferase involved in cell wall biosynthesis [Arthrobacter sp. AG367]|uniref:glycosyltransferase family 4 protein n=1 Tax=Arthrobacter sp. AG367 TaxID=2572909 RepID=UPI00119D423D|nr:glycosyltransferase family 4 protein [Arthrobacter sp. AG367]TWD48165.1 glycosyltransferase involved in cell wall biosynthesis [Arthrobacter sp. AG367]
MKIILLGPVSPSALALHLHPEHAEIARSDDGTHGPSIGALAKGLLDRGHELVIVTHRRGYSSLHLRGRNLEFYRVTSRRSARRQALDGFRYERSQMRSIVNDVQADLIHAHWTYEWANVALSVKLPQVVTIHDAPLSVLKQNRSPYWVLRYLAAISFRLRAANVSMLAVSPYVGRRWSQELLWKNEVAVIPNCVLPTPSHLESPKPEQVQFIEVANASSLKNVRRLIEAFHLVREERPDVRLILIGNGLGPDDDICAWATEQGWATNVRFLGPLSQEQVFDRFKESHVHIHASLEESFGLTLVESMQRGLPVIAGQDSGATSWVLDDGRCGLLADMHDSKSMASCMLSALSQDDASEKRVNAAYKRFLELFSVPAVVRAHEAHYAKLLVDFRAT